MTNSVKLMPPQRVTVKRALSVLFQYPGLLRYDSKAFYLLVQILNSLLRGNISWKDKPFSNKFLIFRIICCFENLNQFIRNMLWHFAGTDHTTDRCDINIKPHF